MTQETTDAASPVPGRLILAARKLFLSDDYHAISTRQIADEAGVNVSMIRYYFGNKEGLYEEMIRQTYRPLLDVLDKDMMSSLDGLGDYLQLYYRTMLVEPEFPRLILKVLALRHGPGRRFILQLLERGRVRGAQKVEEMKQKGMMPRDLDPDMLRLSFVSLAMMPILLKEIFEEQLERPLDEAFLERLAALNGQILAGGLSALAKSAAEVSP